MMRHTVRPVRGYSVRFDGLNDRISMGNNLGFERTASRTIAFWWLGNIDGHPWSKQNTAGNVGPSIYISNSKVQFYLQANAGIARVAVETTNPVLSPTAWRPILITYSGNSNASGVTFYIGSNSATATTTLFNNLGSNSILTTSDFTVGARPDVSGATAFTRGRCKNFALWDKVLDSGERASFFSAGLLGSLSSIASANRLAYWDARSGQNLGSTWPDLDVGFDGTCVNMVANSLRPIYDGDVRAS